MGAGSRIEWTQATWNPVTGCTRASAGCDHCYAARMTRRLDLMGCSAYAGLTSFNKRGDLHFNGIVRCHDDRLDVPRAWRAARLVFVNSMSDLFHPCVPLAFIQRVFAVMNECPQHTFQILTKRPEIAAEFARDLRWGPNIWMGTSVENMLVLDRVRALKRVPAAVRFLSLEPLLGPLPRIPLGSGRRGGDGIHWVIVGGESGPGARPMEEKWVLQILQQCREREVPFFFKQWGGVNKKKAGRRLNGRTWDEMPLAAASIQGSGSHGRDPMAA